MGKPKGTITHLVRVIQKYFLKTQVLKQIIMAIGGNHIALCTFSVMVLTSLIISTASTNWMHTTSKSIQTITDKEYEQRGLWIKCTTVLATSTVSCSGIRSEATMSNLPGWLSYSRIAMIFCCAFSFVATVAAIFGNPVLKCFGASKKVMTWSTAGSLLVCGIMALIAFAWATNATHTNHVKNKGKIADQINNITPLSQMSQFQIGWACYLGFITSILTILFSLYAFKVAYDMEQIEESFNPESQQMYTGAKQSDNMYI